MHETSICVGRFFYYFTKQLMGTNGLDPALLNTVHCMDCLDFMKTLPDGCIDLTVTSPPYDELRDYEGSLFWDFEVFSKIAKELARITKEGGVIVWVVGDATINGSETGTSFRQALFFKDICGMNIHDTMIWEKQTFTDTGSLQTRYAGVFEFMYVFSKGKPITFNPIFDRLNKGPRKKHGTVRQKDGTTKKQSSLGKIYGNTLSQRFNIRKINTEVSNSERKHPAQFPKTLAQDHILSRSNQGDIILDCFAGSGTTGVACKELGRNYILVEKEPKYCDIIHKRLQNTTVSLFHS